MVAVLFSADGNRVGETLLFCSAVSTSEDIVMLLCCRYVGKSFVKAGGRPTDILEKLNEMAGFAPNEEILLYEVCDILFTISVVWIPHS